MMTYRLTCLLLLLLCSGLAVNASNSNNTQDSELKSLSIKELVNIPLDIDYSQQKIYQPEDNPVDSQSVNFGLLTPISIFPIYSAELIAAADLAAEFVNKHGGINNKRLVILRADDHENTPVSARLAKQLVNDYRAQALIGPATSNSVADVLRKVAVPQNIPLITQAASAMELTEIAGEHSFWRMVANNEQQVELIVNHLHKQLKHQRVFIISGRDIYSKEITAGITRYYKQQKDTWIDHMAISSLVYLEGMDLENEIKRIQSNRVTSIVVTLPTAQMTAIIKKIRNHWQGKYPLIMTADTVKPKYLIDAQLGDITQCLLTYVASPTDLAPELKDKITKILNRDSAGFDAAYIYDAVIILSMAKKVSDYFDISFKESVNSLTTDGFPITHYDYPDIIGLYKDHKKFQYSGYSGRIKFNHKGDNLTANMRIYPLAKPDANRQQCLTAD